MFYKVKYLYKGSLTINLPCINEAYWLLTVIDYLRHVSITDACSHVKVCFYVLNLKTTQRRKTDDTNWAFIIILYY